MKKIVIGADKSGFPLKEEIKKYLVDMGYEVLDEGMKTIDEFKPYYEVAPKVAQKIQSGEIEKGILCCGTGAGMAIVANKFKGIYAVAVEGSYSARMSAVINKANVLTIGGWIVSPQMGCDMVGRWLNTGFTEGFPKDRQEFLCNALNEVKNIENKNFK